MSLTYSAFDHYIPFCLSLLSCLVNMLIIFKYFQNNHLRTNINSTYLLIIIAELLFVIFYAMQLVIPQIDNSICNIFCFITQFSFNLQFFSYLFLSCIFIINFYTRTKANFMHCNSFIFIISVFTSIITNQIFILDKQRTSLTVICFLRSHIPLISILTQQALLILFITILTLLFKFKGIQALNTHFLQDYDEFNIVSKEKKMKLYFRIFENYFFILMVGMIIIGLYFIKIDNDLAMKTAQCILHTLICGFPILSFFYRKKYMYTKHTQKDTDNDKSLSLIITNRTINDIQNISCSSSKKNILNVEILKNLIILHFFPRLLRPAQTQNQQEEGFEQHQTRLISQFELIVNDTHVQAINDQQVFLYLKNKPLHLHFYSYAEQAFQQINNTPHLQNNCILKNSFEIGEDNEMVQSFLYKHMKHDNEYSTKYCQDQIQVLFISQQKQQMFVEKFLPLYHQHLQKLNNQSFLTNWLALFSVCDHDLSYKRSVIIMQNTIRNVFQVQSDKPLIKIEYYQNQVDFIRYNKHGGIFKQENFEFAQFEMKKILRLEVNYKVQLMEQLTRDIEFLMESQIYGYKVTLYYYELNEEIKQKRDETSAELIKERLMRESIQIEKMKISRQLSKKFSRQQTRNSQYSTQTLLSKNQSNQVSGQKSKMVKKLETQANFYESFYSNYYVEVEISNYLRIKEKMSDYEKEKQKVQQYSSSIYNKIINDL